MGVRIAVDTNRYRDFCEGDASITDLLEAADQVLVPFVVLGELRAGFSIGRRGHLNESVLQRFLARPGVDVLYPRDSTTRQYAALYRQLRKQGTPIPINDLWIAALVVDHDLFLSTRDRHFRELPQLNIVPPL